MVAQKVKAFDNRGNTRPFEATVSLALRDSPLVAAVTRDKIKEQARALGYIYNRRAAKSQDVRFGIIGCRRARHHETRSTVRSSRRSS